ncbi:hypothetical protein DMENIID0001_075820 [Sergentomyia squamirostris]
MRNNETTQTPEMMTTFGVIENYKPGIMDFDEYLERMEFFFDLTHITDDRRKLATFVTLVGKDVYRELKALVSPRNVHDLTLAEVKKILCEKYSSKNTLIKKRYDFYSRCQTLEESVAAFSADLRVLAQYCAFGDHHKDALRDRFICGLRNSLIKTQLIEDNMKTFEEAVQKARDLEIVERIARQS